MSIPLRQEYAGRSFDVRLIHDIRSKGTKIASPLWQPPANRLNFLLIFSSLVVPVLIHIKGKKVVKNLEQSTSRAKLALFWSVASLSHVFNIYIFTKTGLTGSYHLRKFYLTSSLVFILALGYTLLAVGGISYSHSKYITFPILCPWKTFALCCNKKHHRIIMILTLVGIYISTEILLVCVPYQVLLVSINPHLHGFTVLTVWCVMIWCIILFSIPLTIDQMFVKETKYKLTPKQALQQILLLLFTAFFVFGLGSMTFSIVLFLHLSKYGEKTQTTRNVTLFMFRHVALPVGAWILRKAFWKIRNSQKLIIQK